MSAKKNNGRKRVLVVGAGAAGNIDIEYLFPTSPHGEII
jgi:hypothetical protein